MFTSIAVAVLFVVIFFTACLTPDPVPRHALRKYKREYQLKLRINRAILAACTVALAVIALV